MKFEIVDDGGTNNHLPDFARAPGSGMLGGGLRHLGIVCNGEVVATIWNHHDSTACRDRAERIAALLSTPQPEAEALSVLREAFKVIFHNMDSNGDPIGAQPETSWETGYAAGLRCAYRVLKQRGVELPSSTPKESSDGG